MKKLVTAFAACMLAGLVSAQVESQNVVGYQSMSLVAGVNMIGVNWQAVGGATNISIQGPANALIDDSQIAAGSDQLQVFDTGTQKFTVYTMYPNTGSSPIWDGQWTKVGQGTLIPLSLSTGQGLLFNNAGSAKTLTFKGQADFVSKTNTFAFTAGVNAFACQFPAGFDFNRTEVRNHFAQIIAVPPKIGIVGHTTQLGTERRDEFSGFDSVAKQLLSHTHNLQDFWA